MLSSIFVMTMCVISILLSFVLMCRSMGRILDWDEDSVMSLMSDVALYFTACILLFISLTVFKSQ